VMDKDEGSLNDDFIGTVKVGVRGGAKEVELEGPLLKLRSIRGTTPLSHAQTDNTPTSDTGPPTFPYDFAGPVRYSKHFSPVDCVLTNLNSTRLYSMRELYLVGVSRALGDAQQHWNTGYKAAQSIFQGPASIAVRSGIQAGHRMPYVRSAANGFGVIEDAPALLALLHTGTAAADAPRGDGALAQLVEPAVYTHVVASDDGALRFLETGAAFFVDFASKYALHYYETRQVATCGKSLISHMFTRGRSSRP
ncbi:hypothetical protein HYPSUDRAFT_151630, partial [Hypholoma sublateritium FD-334 SS-4]